MALLGWMVGGNLTLQEMASFPKWLCHFHCHQQCAEILAPLHPSQNLLLAVFSILAIYTCGFYFPDDPVENILYLLANFKLLVTDYLVSVLSAVVLGAQSHASHSCSTGEIVRNMQCHTLVLFVTSSEMLGDELRLKWVKQRLRELQLG